MSTIDPKLIAWLPEQARQQLAQSLDRRIAANVRSGGAALSRVCNNLQTQITNESTARGAGDAANASAITAGDTSLQGQINTEITNRTNAVSAEASARATADIAVQGQSLQCDVSGFGNGWFLSCGQGSTVLGANTVNAITVNSPFGSNLIAVGTGGPDWQDASQVSGGQESYRDHIRYVHINNSGNFVTFDYSVIFIGK